MDNTVNDLSQKNLNLLGTWVDAINHNDIEGELACWQPDGEFTIVPINTTYKGIDQLRNAGKGSATVIGGQPVEGRKQITHLSGGATWALVEYDVHANIAGPIVLGDITLLPEGVSREVVTKTCVVFQMKDGKLYRGAEYFDTTSVAEQLGLDHEVLAKLYSALGKRSSL
jgi:ketosteroid isomerase-like protein